MPIRLAVSSDVSRVIRFYRELPVVYENGGTVLYQNEKTKIKVTKKPK